MTEDTDIIQPPLLLPAVSSANGNGEGGAAYNEDEWAEWKAEQEWRGHVYVANEDGVTEGWIDNVYYPRNYTPKPETPEEKERRLKDAAIRELYRSIPKLDNEFNPAVTTDVFLKLSDYLLEDNTDEIGGFAYYDEASHQIDWIMRDRDGTGQGSSWKGGTAGGMLACLLERDQDANVQWHSHPHITTFFSATDMDNQMELLERSMITPDGYLIFMVVDGLEWKLARFHWKDYRLVGVENGFATLNGRKLIYSRPATAYKTTYYYPATKKNGASGSTYGSAWNVKTRRRNSKGEELSPIEAMYIGYWSADKEDYDILFDMFGVERFDWIELHRMIEGFFPDGYYEVVDEPRSWQAVSDYLNELLAEDDTNPQAAPEAVEHDNPHLVAPAQPAS